MKSLYSRLPAVHRLLATAEVRAAIAVFGRQGATNACRAALDDLRTAIANDTVTGDNIDHQIEDLPQEIGHRLQAGMSQAYPEVINATGIILHTNLGRAPLPQPMPELLGSYLALEYDLDRGQRGQRLAPLQKRIAGVFEAEWAVMVNNNAAALVLILAGLASTREVIVSRSQLIEIGGSFRLPEVMAAAGAVVHEVGCTNRTHLRDYAAALSEQTAAILLVHQSNFRITGFTATPELADLAALAREHDVPLLVDQGSGNACDLSRWGLAQESTVSGLLRAGADLVCFSGDKLLGGPQAGIIVGRRRWVEPLGRHPLYRALRPDKTALVVMDRVLQAHQSGRLEQIPIFVLLATPVESLRRRARALGRRLRKAGVPARGLATRCALGGGTTPDETMPSYGLAIDGGQRLADGLRRCALPVVARIEEDRVILDLRTVFPRQDRALETAITSAWDPALQ